MTRFSKKASSSQMKIILAFFENLVIQATTRCKTIGIKGWDQDTCPYPRHKSKKASSSQMKIIHFKVAEMPTFKDIVVMIAKHSDQPCVTGKKTKHLYVFRSRYAFFAFCFVFFPVTHG
jgi:hypothetical protein